MSKYTNHLFRSTIRTVRINKTEDEPLGFRICGGNKIGIFVSGVTKESPAEIAGLQVGDKIVQVSVQHCAYEQMLSIRNFTVFSKKLITPVGEIQIFA